MGIREYLVEEYEGVTSKDMGSIGEHSHPYKVDNFGNGETLPDNTKHIHKISEFSVQPGGPDGHGHMIKNPMQEQVSAGDIHNTIQMLKSIENKVSDLATQVRNLRRITKAVSGKELKKLEDDLKSSAKNVNFIIKQFGAK